MRRSLSVLVVLAFLAACGGGSGGAGLPPLEVKFLDLGTVASNASTVFQITIENRFNDAATVTEVGSDPGLIAAGGQLPLVLPAGASVNINVLITPPSAGLFTGDAVFVVDAGGASEAQITTVSATVELTSASVNLASLDFGDVLPGTTADRTLIVNNTTSASTLTLAGMTAPNAAFSIVSPALPAFISAGQSQVVTVRYAPTGPGAPTGQLTLDINASNGPFQVFAQATSGGQEVVDFGTVNFDGGGDTAELSFDVPADAISFMIEATTAASTSLGLRLLTGPGGKVYENEQLTGAYIWSAQQEIFNQQVPNTDRTNVQLVPGGGTYKLKLLRWSGGAGSCDIRVIIERRPKAGTDVIATLDLNVFLAAGIAPTAATAANDNTLQAVFTQMNTILSSQGVALGDIDYYDVTDTQYDDVTFAEFGPMLKLSSAANETRLSLFFVREAIGGGILGVSPTLGGPALLGTELSGVMALYTNQFSPQFIGLVAAHELGHFLGLAHTTEQNGAWDDITDTAQCPATGTNGTCPTAGGGYLMHWQAVGGTTITNGQAGVLRGHPFLDARLLGGNPLQAKPAAQAIAIDPNAPQNWCGTCQCNHRVKVK